MRYHEWIYLRTLRLRARKSLTQLAEELNCSRIHLYQVENGARGASEDLIARIADVFDVDIMELHNTRPSIPPRTGGGGRRRASTTNTSENAEVA